MRIRGPLTLDPLSQVREQTVSSIQPFLTKAPIHFRLHTGYLYILCMIRDLQPRFFSFQSQIPLVTDVVLENPNNKHLYIIS